MTPIKKYVIGIRPASKMFRVSSLIGLILDSILSERGGKVLEDEYYAEIMSNHRDESYGLKNEELGNTLTIDLENIVFTKDYYGSASQFDFKKVFSEFSHVWKIINAHLKVHDVRRIGIVTEYQFEYEEKKVNKKLIESLTSFKEINSPAKFMLRFENRYPTPEGLAPDINKSDFINVIYNFYDGNLDVDHPNKGSINANIDVQRYFSPLSKSSIPDEVAKLDKKLIKEREKLEGMLKDRGLINNGEK